MIQGETRKGGTGPTNGARSAGQSLNPAPRVGRRGIGKQALILVGDVLKARREGLKAVSRLYDREFSHEFRSGIVA